MIQQQSDGNVIVGGLEEIRSRQPSTVRQRFAMRVNRITTAVTALAAILSASLPARAATYTWTGGDGSSNSWYSAGNWAGGAVPLTSLRATTSSPQAVGIPRRLRLPLTAQTVARTRRL